MGRAGALIRCVVLLGAAMAPAGAQSVRGVVMERDVRRPLPAVVVLLLDARENAVARALSDERGAFALTAPAPGTYRIRTLRIGFRQVTTEPMDLRAGAEETREIEVASVAFLLDTIRVLGRNVCRDQSGADVASAVWEQARTALIAAQISARLPAVNARLVIWERLYDPGSPRARRQTSTIRSGLTPSVWQSLPPDSLRRVGYVTEDDRGWTSYFVPDVTVLLSPEFQADHCVTLVRSRGDAETGIRFEPSRERGNVPEIRGTIWLDTRSAELRRMEFRYVNVGAVQESEGAGGEMEFVRLRNGGVAISRWSLRMPVVALRTMAGRPSVAKIPGPQERLAEIKVVGGDLIAVTVRDDTLWSRAPWVLSGTAVDSASGRGVAGARVTLAGTPKSGVSDTRGRFEIRDVLPGEYTMEVRTASLDSMSAVHRTEVLFLEEAPLEVKVAAGHDLAALLCSTDRSWNRASPPGIVLGSARLTGDSLPPRNVPVVAEWAESAALAGGQVSEERRTRWKQTRTDSRGAFRLCGLPVNTPITIRAEGDSADAAPVQVRFPDGKRFERAELVLDRFAERSATFSGSVFIDSTQQPIPDAEVALPGLLRSMLTDEQGRFRFAEIPAGRHRVVVRRLGYGPLDTTVTFSPGRSESRRIVLSRVTLLDTVAVTALRLRDFEDHRRLGLGYFMTRSEIARLEHSSMPGLLGQFPMLHVAYEFDRDSRLYGWFVSTRRPVKVNPSATNPLGVIYKCYAQVYVDKLLVYRGGDDEPKFDINSIRQHQIEAIEWYSSPIQLPSEYSLRSARCGVLVIHTRRPP